MENIKRTCIDCAVKNCNLQDKTYPDFCLTVNMDDDVLKEAMELYKEDENGRSMIAAAEVEYDFYGKRRVNRIRV